MSLALRRCFIIALLLLVSTHIFAANLQALTIQKTAQVWQIRARVSDNFRYNSFLLEYPNRLVIDLHDTSNKVTLSTVKLAKTPIKRIRSAVRKQHDLRLVFDLRNKLYSHAEIKTEKNRSSRQLIVTLRTKPFVEKPIYKHKLLQPVKKPVNKPVKTVKQHKKLRDVIVVIDPGHGGKDPGAIGTRRTREKNVVLAISKELQRLINRNYGMHAVLTRGGDYYISLRQRLRLARRGAADLFIAVHADAYKKTSSRGASIFVLSERGATSEAARWLAARENYSEVGQATLKDKSYWVRSLLIDLSQTATIVASLELGQGILNKLGKFAKLHNKKVEQARFVVLKSPDIPSILIETGFISNRQEELLLRRQQYRKKLARAIMQGVVDYFKEHASEDTLIYKIRRSRAHKVKRGESLSVIAKRYHVSMNKLKRFNHLRNNNIRIGQGLRIPR